MLTPPDHIYNRLPPRRPCHSLPPSLPATPTSWSIRESHKPSPKCVLLDLRAWPKTHYSQPPVFWVTVFSSRVTLPVPISRVSSSVLLFWSWGSWKNFGVLPRDDGKEMITGKSFKSGQVVRWWAISVVGRNWAIWIIITGIFWAIMSESSVWTDCCYFLFIHSVCLPVFYFTCIYLLRNVFQR